MSYLLIIYTFCLLLLLFPLILAYKQEPEAFRYTGLAYGCHCIILFVSAGSFFNGLAGGNPFRIPLIIFTYTALFLAQIYLEFALLYRRIKDGYYLEDFKRNLVPVLVVQGVFFIIAAGLFSLQVIGIGQRVVRPILQIYAFIYPVSLFFQVNGLFGISLGVIQKKRRIPFVILALCGVLQSVWTSSSPESILPNCFFAIPVFVFFFRFFIIFVRNRFAVLGKRLHLQETHEKTITMLVKKSVRSPVKESNELIGEILNTYLERIRKEMVVPDYCFTGAVLFRCLDNALLVDSPAHITGYCTPLEKGSVFKSMTTEDIKEVFLKSLFLVPGEKDETSFLGKALFEVCSSLEPRILPAPDFMSGMQRLVVFFPISDGDRLQGVLVLFKDSFSLVHEYEQEMLHELTETLSLLLSIIAGKEQQAQQLRIKDELEIARRIQTSIVPRNITIAGYDTASLMVTATEVGGDVFDCYSLGDENYLSIGDVSGHGLPAGIMAIVQLVAFHSLLEVFEKKGIKPKMDELYDMVNRILCRINQKRLGSDKFMTGNILREKDGEFEYVGTHEIAVMYRAGTGKIEEMRGMVNRTGFLGLSELVRSQQSVGAFSMEEGDILVLYTDGVIEAKNRYKQQFGLERLKNLLYASAEENSEAIIDRIMQAVLGFARDGDLKKNNGNMADDVTLLVLKKEAL